MSDGVKIIFIGICRGRLLFLWKHEKFAVGAHVLVNTQNVVIPRCCFAEDGYEMYQVLLCTCRAIVLFIKAFVLPRSRWRYRRSFLTVPIAVICTYNLVVMVSHTCISVHHDVAKLFKVMEVIPIGLGGHNVLQVVVLDSGHEADLAQILYQVLVVRIVPAWDQTRKQQNAIMAVAQVENLIL